MAIVTKIGIFLALLAAPVSGASSLLDSAHALASRRHINFDCVRQSEKILVDLVAADSANPCVRWNLARTCYFLGDHDCDRAEQLRCYERGAEQARRAIALDSTCFQAHYWYAVELGLVAQSKGPLKAMALVSELKQECSTMERLDSCNAPGLELTAMVYAGLPAFLGGGGDRPEEYLRRALRCDANYTTTYVDLARMMIERKDYAAARALMQRMFAVQSPTDAGETVLHDLPAGRQLLAEIEGK
jgi:hypothetical protein